MKLSRLLWFVVGAVALVAVSVAPFRHYMLAHGLSVGVSGVVPRPPSSLRATGPSIVVDKSERKLYLYDGRRLVRAYRVALGPAKPTRDKQVEGDGATPVGRFIICQKQVLEKPSFLGTRWMRLSYPNAEDTRRGLQAGLISQPEYEEIVFAINDGRTPPQRTKLGGGIGIHGGNFTVLGREVPDWTAGCVGLFDRDAEELFGAVKVGTPVQVRY